MKRHLRVAVVLAACAVAFCAAGYPAMAADESAEGVGQEKTAGTSEVAAIVFSVAIVVSVSCLAAGYAVAHVGAAALGAASENPEMFGKSILFVGLAEGIAIYGLLIGILLLAKL